jgi:LysR family cys regulon transcriptional activator
MTLAQLRYLLAIVDANMNITVAAQRVNATQPGLSKQLKLLEEELGFQIFVRRGKSLESISRAGSQVVERARVLLSEAANIHALAANHRQESAGELVIATTQTQARFMLPPALQRLKAHSPDVSVRLNLFSDAERAASAREDADLLIASAVDWPQTADLVAPLYRWRRVALMPADHPLAQARGPLTLADLSAYPLIGYESALGSHATVAAAFAEAGARADFTYTAHDTEVIRTFVSAGLGIGLIAEMAVGDDRDLVHRPIEGLPACHAYALLRRDRVARDYVIDLVAALTPHFNRRDFVRGLQPGGALPSVTAPDWRDWQALVRERDLNFQPTAVARQAAA